MQAGTRKIVPTISQGVKEFLQENNVGLQDISVQLLKEKVFTDKKEYILDISLKNKTNISEYKINDEEIKYAINILEKIFSFMNLKLNINSYQQNGLPVIKITSDGKDGLIIGKNGQNLASLQYFISIVLNKKFHKQIPILIDIDSYLSKRITYLKNYVKTLANNVLEKKSETITDLLPPHERKIIHEEIKAYNLKSFSVGKGPYKKVVITALL
ncbi:MAG: KH domain-containing protein [Candidatus Goldbacteria bacterium]|nr:KH domain-containing protein [Candidatus Goldiibacteriota bacterium]